MIHWKRGPDRSLVSGDYTIVVCGESATGKACVWEVKYRGESISYTGSKGTKYNHVTFTKRDMAKRYVMRRINQETQS
jgi:hypothetical protein